MGDNKPKTMPALDLISEDARPDQKETSSTRSSRASSNADPSDQLRSIQTNLSPTRSATTHGPLSTVPSAAAVQRAISATRSGPSSLDGMLDSSKDRLLRSGQTSPAWPTSPRLKSPPPSVVRSMIPRRPEYDHAQSNTSVKRLAPVSAPELGAAMQIPSEEAKETVLHPTTRVLARNGGAASGLETVVEGSVPTTPSIGPVIILSDEPKSGTSDLETLPETPLEPLINKTDTAVTLDPNKKVGAVKAEPSSVSAPVSRATSNARPESNLAKRSFTSLTATKSKHIVEPMRSMTIETEPVTSTPQLLGDRGRDTGGSLRTKPSNETIRPKKEKKRVTRKGPSLQAGTATSKADIFEAKVASAVDEADSSDSDETFVYESNPPEPRQNRHHSRTPSATSVASQADYYGGRGKHGVRSNSTAIPGKRSMKFSSSLYGGQLDAEGSGGDASRSSTRTHSSTPRHHHIGRYGRNGHASIIDSDSPFTQANRLSSPRTPTASNARASRPGSPRNTNPRFSSMARKSVAAGYDAYDDGADDERAPLIGSVRVNRTRHSRRGNGQFRPLEFGEEQEPGCWPRFGGCVMLALLVMVVLVAITTFVVALNRPLLDVEVKHVQNVLVSEQELLLDLQVCATNPNLFAIAVNDLGVDLFAESPYAGTAEQWDSVVSPISRRSWTERRPRSTSGSPGLFLSSPPVHPEDGVDEGTDPIEEPGAQKMLLGRIIEFDSPLVFDPSPVRHNMACSVGEIRLVKPGNHTEIGGSKRWERVLQHPFDLIVRGVIRYQLPLSSRPRSAKIAGRIRVSPDTDDGDGDGDGNGDRNGTIY